MPHSPPVIPSHGSIPSTRSTRPRKLCSGCLNWLRRLSNSVRTKRLATRCWLTQPMFRRDGAACLAAWNRVFALNPNFCDWRHGQCLVLLGRPEEGLVAIRRYMRLDPFFPPHALMVEGLAHLVDRRYQLALPPFREMIARAPDFRNGRLMLAATYAHIGETREARRQVEELLRVEPDCSLKKLS